MGLRWVGVVLGLLVPWVNDITLESLCGVGSTLGGYQIQAAAINTPVDSPFGSASHSLNMYPAVAKIPPTMMTKG